MGPGLPQLSAYAKKPPEIRKAERANAKENGLRSLKL